MLQSQNGQSVKNLKACNIQFISYTLYTITTLKFLPLQMSESIRFPKAPFDS